MKINKFLPLFLLMILSNCSTNTNKNQGELKSDSLFVKQSTDHSPKVAMEIYLVDTVLHYGDKILLNIKLTNTDTTIQKILFDKPITSGIPWGTTGEVIDITTKKSVLKSGNLLLLSSRIYSEEELESGYYFLKANQSVSGNYELNNIVSFNTENKILPKGTYEVQLFYFDNPSNKLTFQVK